MGKHDRPYLPIYTLHQITDSRFRPLGLVVIHKTEGMGVLRDLIARLKDLTGGRVGAYDRSVNSDLIFPALRELSDQAHDIYTIDGVSPDAIMGLVMDVQSVSSKGMAMQQITAYGTAVRYLTPEEEAAIKPAESKVLEALHPLIGEIRQFNDEIRRWFTRQKSEAERAGREDHATVGS